MPQVVEHTPDEVRSTLMPIAQILEEGGKFEDAGEVVREWCGVSDAPAARDAFCDVLEASSGIESLEFTMDTKRHWRFKLDRGTFDRIIALAVEGRRRSAALRINLVGHRIGGASCCLSAYTKRTGTERK